MVLVLQIRTVRSSRPELFCEKRVLRNFSKFTGKHLCQSLFLIKLQVWGLRPATLFKKRPWHRCFPVNFMKLLRTPFLQNTSGWLLLAVLKYQHEWWKNLLVLKLLCIKVLFFWNIKAWCLMINDFLILYKNPHNLLPRTIFHLPLTAKRCAGVEVGILIHN